LKKFPELNKFIKRAPKTNPNFVIDYVRGKVPTLTVTTIDGSDETVDVSKWNLDQFEELFDRVAAPDS
jgi:hypothetical protein